MSQKRDVPLIQLIYAYVCQQPGFTADQYLQACKASIRSGGVLTHLEYAGYIRFEKSASDPIKKWYPVLINGVAQKFDPKHPYFVEQANKKKQSQLPEMKYHIELGKVMDRIVKLDFTDEEKFALYDQLINEGYAHALRWKSCGYSSMAVGARFAFEECQAVNAKIDQMLKDKGQFESDEVEDV